MNWNNLIDAISRLPDDERNRQVQLYDYDRQEYRALTVAVDGNSFTTDPMMHFAFDDGNPKKMDRKKSPPAPELFRCPACGHQFEQQKPINTCPKCAAAREAKWAIAP